MFRYVDALCLLPLYMYPKTHTHTHTHTRIFVLSHKHQEAVPSFVRPTTVQDHKCSVFVLFGEQNGNIVNKQGERALKRIIKCD